MKNKDNKLKSELDDIKMIIKELLIEYQSVSHSDSFKRLEMVNDLLYIPDEEISWLHPYLAQLTSVN